MFTEWRDSLDESPAGGMTGTGIHMLDALIAVVGGVQGLLLSHKSPPDPLDSLSVLLGFGSGISGTLAAVRSTPMHLRVHAFGRNASAEALGRTDLTVRRSGAEPQHLSFPPIDSVRVNPKAFADAVAGRTPYPISTGEMLYTVAAFEAIAEAVSGDGRTGEV
jgi:predicted dehydrogenase